MDRALQQAVASNKFKLIKAECLAFLGRFEEAQEIANDILHLDAMNVDALYVRGMCLYYQDFIEKSYSHLQQVLRLAPDYSKVRDLYRKVKLLMTKKDEGNEAFKKGRLQEAYNLYSSALEIDPSNVYTNAKLYFNRATVCAKISKVKEAIEDCTEAIRLDENYIKAYLRRAKCSIFCTAHKQLLEQAKLELKKSKRKNYYKILGVEKNASEEEIRKAYRKRALLHHPDRHTSASEEERREQEKKFKEVGEAYNVLSDHKKRVRYDSGQDLEDMEGFGGGDIDPNHIFQTFFGGSGGFTFSNFGGGNFSQVPSGFSFQFG
ncbi:dnaJ homolog subfamily C member 7-like [Limulus polyphemus]|uniref:DnaJ homolog subfamily C member 7-like n=1 Tax=Limulus polyphemus TaxID=6850 RepID=A0ABM1RX19_LIMPO|nr:dnaJ homolog subfamily C member 7-like [Limulus polyphemus]